MFVTTNTRRSLRCSLVVTVLGLLPGLAMNPDALAAERAATLEQQLIEFGWSSHQASDGTVTLTPPTGKAIAENEVETSTNRTLATEIRRSLENQGWISTRSDDGTVTLVSPARQRETESTREPHESPVPGSESDPKADKPSSAFSAEMRTKLESRGWKLIQNADGSIALYPPSAQGVGDRSDQQQPLSEPVTGMTNSLSAPEQADVACGWWIADSIRANTFKLPVDTWEEAQSIAQSWVTHEAGSDLRTGKIRKILRIYLISIVENRSPYRLRHQLAIRAKDGHLTVLD